MVTILHIILGPSKETLSSHTVIDCDKVTQNICQM